MPPFGFGAAATATTSAPAAINFGFGSNAAQSGSSGGGLFGAATSTATTTAASGFSFGAAAPATTTTAATTGFSFAATPATTAATPATGFSFGSTPAATTATAATGLSLGATTAAPATGFSFGTTPATSAATNPLLGGAATSAAATSQPSQGFFGLGGTATSTAATTAASLGLGGAAPTSTALPGLGGAQPPAPNPGTAVSGTEGKPSKDTPLPQDVFATIAAFESFKAEEKAASEENLRQSGAAFHKLGEDCAALRVLVTQLAATHADTQRRVNALKQTIVADSRHVEMARRTHATPPHLQGDNTLPEAYFAETLKGFEERMKRCKEGIDDVEQCLAVTGSGMDTETAVKELVRRQHAALQTVAARVYALHSALLALHAAMPGCPEHLAPQALFKAGAGDLSRLAEASAGLPAESAVTRSCFQDASGGSRLGAYQVNTARARATALPPPTTPLQGGLLGANQSSLGGGGLFGNTATAKPGGLFGNSAASNTGGLFGNNNTANTSGGLFGSTNTTGGLFGNNNAAKPGGLFGNNTTTGGLFNNTNNNTFNSGSSSLFSSPFGQPNKLFK